MFIDGVVVVAWTSKVENIRMDLRWQFSHRGWAVRWSNPYRIVRGLASA